MTPSRQPELEAEEEIDYDKPDRWSDPEIGGTRIRQLQTSGGISA